ncbi:MAG: ABC transporter permease [Paludibacter sp.]|nr:ABC transporter permease [Paludibacter sp.]
MQPVKLTLKDRYRELLFSIKIAQRYLFSKKSHNAINIITAISSTGVAIGTMALVVVLSVFNGFEGLVSTMFSSFDPELRITMAEGKRFSVDEPEIQKLKSHNQIAVFTQVVEENALLRFRDKQMPATIKGVSANFRNLTQIDSLMYDGKFELFDGAFERAVPGIGVASILGLGAHFIDPLYIYAPKRNTKINILRPENSFNQTSSFVSGIFNIQQAQYDDKYVLVSLNHARELFEYDSNSVSSIELKLRNTTDIAKIQNEITTQLGEKYKVKNRMEQQESFFNIMKIEKWITFLILSFILLIASFNIIGSLSMLIIDKKSDIKTLESLGANKKTIHRIFLFEGWLIAFVGALAGVSIGTLLCVIQEKMGLIKLGPGFVVDAYPVITNCYDILLIFSTVLTMGLIAAWYPVRYIK